MEHIGKVIVRGVKEQKIVQNDQKFYVLHSVSQEAYIMLCHMVYKC